MNAYNTKRDELIKLSNQDHFSNTVNLTKRAFEAEKKLKKLRKQMLEMDPTCAIGDYYSKLPFLLKSDLYDCLNVMPKPAVHHIHLTAAVKVDFLVSKILYYDHVYFNREEQMFKVTKKVVSEPGYVKVNELRQYWSSSQEFDAFMMESILLPDECIKTKEHHVIWKYFQPKFMMCNDLYNYAEFFEKILYRASRDMVEQLVTIIEWKHIFGMVFDEDGILGVERECQIFERVRKVLKERFPLFNMKIVACGLKIVGKDHIQSQIDAYFEAQKYTDMVIGFDMVNEEDFTPPIDDFLP